MDSNKSSRAALLIAKRIAKAGGGPVLGDNRKQNLSKFLEGNHPYVPEVLYHGTVPRQYSKQVLDKETGEWSETPYEEKNEEAIKGSNFSTFKTGYGTYGDGIYLTDNPDLASNFAQGIRADNKEIKPHGHVIKAHVSMKMPFTDDVLKSQVWIDHIKEIVSGSIDGAGRKGFARNPLVNHPDPIMRNRQKEVLDKLDNRTATVRDLFLVPTEHGDVVAQDLGCNFIGNSIRRSGYDGIISHRPDGSKEVVAFKPEQVKSAIGNRGTFDPSDADMTKAAGGRVRFAEGGATNDLLGRPEGVDSEFESISDKDFKPPRVRNDIGLYSKAAEIARSLPQQNGDANQLVAAIKNKGVKPSEIENAGLPRSNGNISKEMLARHFERNVPDLKVVRLEVPNFSPVPLTTEEYDRLTHLSNRNAYGIQHAEGPLNPEEHAEFTRLGEQDEAYFQYTFNPQVGEDETRYESYKTPGGENYREHLLTLPGNKSGDYNSSHWDQQNVVAHVRMQDMKAEHGEKTLHVDEIQSDWGQEGREKGFSNPEKSISRKKLAQDTLDKYDELKSSGLDDRSIRRHPEYSALAERFHQMMYGPDTNLGKIPKAPYVQNTQQWVDLALKHTLNEAAKGDYDKVQFATGGENADRYGLEKRYSSIHYDPVEKKLHTIDKSNNHFVIPSSEEDLPSQIGSDLSEKLLATDPGPSDDVGHDKSIFHELKGEDLKFGGEGMRSFYDKILPKSAMKLIQQHDPNIKPEKIKGADGVERFGFSFTPAAKRSILKGQPAFAAGGAVKPSEEQKEAGNYKKRHIKVHGIDISIENDKGSTRSGKDASGKPWSVKMPADYGYVKRTVGADGDHVDVYIGPTPESTSVFVVDQKDLRSGKFDEHKVMLGFPSLHDAEETYISGFSDGHGRDRMGKVTRLTIDEFKSWLKHHDTTKPLRSQGLVDKALALTKQLSGGKK